MMAGVPKPLHQLLKDTGNAKDKLRAWTVWRDSLYPLIKSRKAGDKDEANSKDKDAVSMPQPKPDKPPHSIDDVMHMPQTRSGQGIDDQDKYPPHSIKDVMSLSMSKREKAYRPDPSTELEDWRREVVKYGELAQVAYDSLLSTNVYSVKFGGCRFSEGTDFSAGGLDYLTSLGPDSSNYEVKKLLYADSGFYDLIEQSGERKKNFMGYVAKERKPNAQKGNEVEVVIAWRGTITRNEWFSNVKFPQVIWNDGKLVATAPKDRLKLNPLEVLGVKWFLLAFGGLSLVKWHSLLLLPGAVSSVLAATPWGAVALVSFVLGVVQGVCTTLKSRRYLLLTGAKDDNADNKDDDGKKTSSSVLWKDVQKWPSLVGQWAWFFAKTLSLTQISADARVEYGFKEVYTEADPDVLLKAGEAGTPRMQVYRTLAELGEELENDGLRIGRIITTGHSLGGALASLNAYDLSTTLNGADPPADKDNAQPRAESPPKDFEVELKNNIKRVCKHMWGTKAVTGSPVPVSACTFAAPRTGDVRFAKAFEDFVKPFEGGLASNFWFLFDQTIGFTVWFAVLSSTLTSSFGLSWADAGVRSALALVTWAALPYARQLVFSITSNKKSSEKPLTELKMLRVVHVHDLAPKIPRGWLTILSPYRHAGTLLERDMYPVDVYKKTSSDSLPLLGGAGINARHNLEAYLHMVDPARDPALMNKSTDALVDEARIPVNWRNPDINKGLELMRKGPRKGLWRERTADDDETTDNETHGFATEKLAREETLENTKK